MLVFLFYISYSVWLDSKFEVWDFGYDVKICGLFDNFKWKFLNKVEMYC